MGESLHYGWFRSFTLLTEPIKINRPSVITCGQIHFVLDLWSSVLAFNHLNIDKSLDRILIKLINWPIPFTWPLPTFSYYSSHFADKIYPRRLQSVYYGQLNSGLIKTDTRLRCAYNNVYLAPDFAVFCTESHTWDTAWGGVRCIWICIERFTSHVNRRKREDFITGTLLSLWRFTCYVTPLKPISKSIIYWIWLIFDFLL